MDTTLVVPQGSYTLTRNSVRKNELLRAWDAADEYLLHYIYDEAILADDSRLLILNDSFGSLAISLHKYTPVAISDSFLSQQATINNLKSNLLPGDSVQMHSVLNFTDDVFDVVIIKAPKTLALLEFELIKLRACITESTRVILAGMTKALTRSVWELCERIIGPTTTLLARKKSRLILVKLNKEIAEPHNPYPVCYQLENTDYQICNHANVFSRDNLDIGTRFFLQHLPDTEDAGTIIDLGCGNGVVGLIAAKRNPSASIIFVDESYMAIASAKLNFHSAYGDERNAEFVVSDGLTGFKSASADIMLCNPPFHQQQTVGDHIAQQMFKQSYKVLKTGGELWVIGNRHLAYHVSLKRIFGNVTQIAANNKFVIMKAIK